MCDNTAYINLLLEETSLSSNCLRNNLKYVDESRVFQNTTEPNQLTSLISTINSKLHAFGDDRSKALLLLELFLSQCPTDLYGDYVAGWMQQCCRWNQQTIEDELRILRHLIENSVSNPEVKKHITSNILPRFAERLTNVDKNHKSIQTVINTLRCLRSLIHCYSSSCGPHRGIFQKYVMYCLTEHTKNYLIICEASACFVALCECGPKGQQGINFKEAWTSKFTLLINTCHKLLDLVYSNVDFVGLVGVEQIEEFLPELLDVTVNAEITPMKRYHRLMERYGIIVELIRAMLLCKYSTSKSFRPNDVLNLTCRVLSVTGKVLEKCVQTNDILALAAVVPLFHERAFDIIHALITSVKRNLIPYGSLVCKLCLQSLKWTNSNEWAYGSQKPYQSLRCKVYEVLSSWMRVAASSSSIEIFADEIISIVVGDIEFVKPSVKLTVTTKTNPKKGKSRKRGHAVIKMNTQSDSSVLIDQTANANVCVAAHRTLQLLLRSASVLIKWEHHKYLQYVILPLLTVMFDSLSSTRYPLPYADSKCRLQLFASLLSLVQDPHPKWTAPLSLTIRFLTRGSRDENVEVASFCKTALCQVETVIHPRCPTLYFASEIGGEPSALNRSEMPPNSDTLTPAVRGGFSQEEVTNPVVSIAKYPKLDSGSIPRMIVDDENVPATLNDGDAPYQIRELSILEGSEVTPNAEIVTPVVVADDAVRCSREVTNTEMSMSSSSNSSETPATAMADTVGSREMEKSAEVEEISVEPSAKKSRLSAVKEVDDEKVAAMLNDFVDTWE